MRFAENGAVAMKGMRGACQRGQLDPGEQVGWGVSAKEAAARCRVHGGWRGWPFILRDGKTLENAAGHRVRKEWNVAGLGSGKSFSFS
jgi:hypothetical protein